MKSIAIEFDTWSNAELDDPDNNHVSVHTTGDESANSADEFFSIGGALKGDLPNFSDGNLHTVRIDYRDGVLFVSVDQTQVLSVAVDLNVLGFENGRAYVGFVAGTGAAFENHDIASWSFQSAGEGINWVAGRDLKANEKPDDARGAMNPNPTVPEWSYGTRTDVASTSLDLFPAGDHTDASGVEALEGWRRSDDAIVAVNVDTARTSISGVQPYHPGEIQFHPPQAGYSVVRWTAPAPGSYFVRAFWQDADWNAGDGASAHIVVNGSSIFDASFANRDGAHHAAVVSLEAGATVDFLLGTNSTNLADSARFDAMITPVAEGATTWVAGRDLVTNEKPDEPDAGSTELENPNGVVPQWSYGRRSRQHLPSNVHGLYQPGEPHQLRLEQQQ